MIRILLMSMLVFAGMSASAQQTANAGSAELRVLDKVTGAVSDMTIAAGGTGQIGLLAIVMNECRYPRNNPNGDAYVQVAITYRSAAEPTFAGWLIASAPALNAMDHPRYDVWALRCVLSS